MGGGAPLDDTSGQPLPASDSRVLPLGCQATTLPVSATDAINRPTPRGLSTVSNTNTSPRLHPDPSNVGFQVQVASNAPCISPSQRRGLDPLIISQRLPQQPAGGTTYAALPFGKGDLACSCDVAHVSDASRAGDVNHINPPVPHQSQRCCVRRAALFFCHLLQPGLSGISRQQNVSHSF